MNEGMYILGGLPMLENTWDFGPPHVSLDSQSPGAQVHQNEKQEEPPCSTTA